MCEDISFGFILAIFKWDHWAMLKFATLFPTSVGMCEDSSFSSLCGFQWSFLITAMLVTVVPSLSAPSFLSGPICVHSSIYYLRSFTVLRIYFKKCSHVDVSFGERVAYMMMMCYCMATLESMILNCFSAQHYLKVCWHHGRHLELIYANEVGKKILHESIRGREVGCIWHFL